MAETINPNPTPKQRFMGGKQRMAQHNALMNHPQLRDSLDTALLEQQRIVCSPQAASDGNSAAAAQFILRGSQHFVEIFLKLSIAPQQPEQSKIIGLDHRA